MKGLLSQPQGEQAQPKQAGRKANEMEQGAYGTMVKQVIGFIAQPKVAAKLEEMVQKFGPDRALAMIIMQALQMVGQAAKSAGADIATHTGKAAIKEIVMVMSSMMQASGLTDDAQRTAQGVMQLIAEGMFGQKQQGGAPEGAQAQQMPPQGAQPQQMPLGA
jgi:hypothetical protein